MQPWLKKYLWYAGRLGLLWIVGGVGLDQLVSLCRSQDQGVATKVKEGIIQSQRQDLQISDCIRSHRSVKLIKYIHLVKYIHPTTILVVSDLAAIEL